MKDLVDKEQEIVAYYNKWESLWGYRLLLGGTKHFGFYPEGKPGLSFHEALRLMEGELVRTLDLPEGSLVLDCGCGEGDVALYLAKNSRSRVKGVDLLDFNIARANRKIVRRGLQGRVDFQRGSYERLPFEPSVFDAVYTMESLVHASDYRKALAQFRRVLKPGGKIVLFEYSVPPREALDSAARQAFDFVIETSAMNSLPSFTHGIFPEILEAAGFGCESERDITSNVLPMMHRFSQIGRIPYAVAKAAGFERTFANAAAGVELYRYRKYWRYNIVVGWRR